MAEKPQCIETVFHRGGWRKFRCSRAGAVERDGKHYCRQHDPIAAKERRDKIDAEHMAKFDKEDAERRVQRASPALLAACERALRWFTVPGEFETYPEVEAELRAAIAAAKPQETDS